MAVIYWVGGVGNWDASTTHWANASGGTGGTGTVPTSADDVIFDANSGTGTITITAVAASCKTLTKTGANAQVLTFSNHLNLYGNITTNSSLTFSGTVYSLYFNASSNINIASTFTARMVMQAVGATYSLTAPLTSSNTSVGIDLTNGSFVSNGYTMSMVMINSTGSATRSFDISNSIVNLTGTSSSVTFTTIGLTYTDTNSEYRVTAASGTATFNKNSGGSFTFNKIKTNTSGSTCGVAIYYSCTINTIENLVGHSGQWRFGIGSNSTETFTINNFNLKGSTISNRPTVTRNISGDYSDTVTLTINNQPTNTDWITFTYVKSVNTLFAGQNSTVLSCTNIVTTDYPSPGNFGLKILESGTAWTVPSDWTSNSNLILIIGGGGGGAGGAGNTSVGCAGGGGGGGGVRILRNVSLTPGASIPYSIGSGGVAGVGNATSSTGGSGGTTTFNTSYSATGGTGGAANGSTGVSTGGSGGSGDYAGGTGGVGGNVPATNYLCGGGGGGAAGLWGNGANGGSGYFTGNISAKGGGGGSASGGGAGANGTTTTNTNGGTNIWGFSTTGFGQMGSGGGNTAGGGGGYGGYGYDLFQSIGSGGGGSGYGSITIDAAIGGSYGGGGGAGGKIGTTSNYDGSGGAQGAIIIMYNLGKGNFLAEF